MAITATITGLAALDVQQGPGNLGHRFFSLGTSAAQPFTHGNSGISPLPSDLSFEIDAGDSITLYFHTGTANLAPPDAANTVNLRVYYETGTGTLVRTLHSGAPPANGTSYTFYGTDNGLVGGSPRAGTVRLFVNAIRTGSAGGLNDYNLDSDDTTNGTVGVNVIRNQSINGLLRSNMKVSSIAVNAYPAGSHFAYGPTANENVVVTATHTQPFAVLSHADVKLDILDGAAIQKAGSQVDATGTTRVETVPCNRNNFDPSLKTYGARFSRLGNSLLVPDSGAIAWTDLVDDSGGALSGDEDSLEDQTLFDADPREFIYAGAGMTLPDEIAVHRDSGRTEPNKLFKRKAPVNLTNAVPYLSFYAFNSRDEAIQRQWSLQVERHTDNADEDSQSITGNGSGQFLWNYTIADTDLAFNRDKGTEVNSVDDSAAPPLSVPESDVFDSDFYGDRPGPYPAYPKEVHIIDAANGIDLLFEDVFGVNSEGHKYVWTGDLGQAIQDANGATIGVGRRTKNLGTGALRGMPCSTYDEGNGVLVDASRWALTDVAGRPIDVDNNGSDDYWHGRVGSVNLTAGAIEEVLADTSNPERLQTELAYANAFVSHAAPSDPSIIDWLFGYADNTTQRDNFIISYDGGDETSHYGFQASDVGNYGATSQQIQFIVVDPDLNFFVTASKLSTYPGDSVTITAQMIRLLPSQAHVSVTPDGPLWIKILSGDGTVVVDEAMTAKVGSLVNEFEYVFNSAIPESYSVLVSGFKDGSRPPDAGDVGLTFNSNDPLKNIQVTVDHAPGTDPREYLRHISPGDPIHISAWVHDAASNEVSLLDDQPTPQLVCIRHSVADAFIEYWDFVAEEWVVYTIGQPISSKDMPLNPVSQDHYSTTIATDDSWSVGHVNFGVLGYIDALPYFGTWNPEFSGRINAHHQIAPQLTPFVGDFSLPGRHWSPGDDFTVTVLALRNDDGTLVSNAISSQLETHTILAVDQGTKTITVEGDVTASTEVGQLVDIVNSTGNDGTYTVEAYALNGSDTDFTFLEALPSAVVDGDLEHDHLQPTAIMLTADNLSLQLDGSFALGPLVSHGLPGGSRTWSGAETANWPEVPLFGFVSSYVEQIQNVNNDIFDVPFTAAYRFDVLGSKNRHDRNDLDAVALALGNELSNM